LASAKEAEGILKRSIVLTNPSETVFIFIVLFSKNPEVYNKIILKIHAEFFYHFITLMT
jgi:hypothetical protein